MKLDISREGLLKPLQQVIGAVERRQTSPALANVLLRTDEGAVELTGTDLEVELRARTDAEVQQGGETTVSARKLFDICKTLPGSAGVSLELENEQLRVRAGRSRFMLATLPATEFPLVDEFEGQFEFAVPQADLKHAVDRIGFAMAQQDVRYYLNGLLLELDGQRLRAVATDGHRLSMCEIAAELPETEGQQVIVPRKGVNELARLLDGDSKENVAVRVDGHHIQIRLPGLRFTSKLIDARFPDYTRVVPDGGDRELRADRELLRQALARTAILSNEKVRGVRLDLSGDGLRLQSQNPDKEEAEEEVEIVWQGEPLQIGFNVNYLLDILGSLEGDEVHVRFGDSNSSCLVTDPASGACQHVVMPMRL